MTIAPVPDLKTTIHPLKRYRQLRAIASYKGNWEECRVKSCRVRKRCTGGIRGTFSRLGIPGCMEGLPLAEMTEVEPDKAVLPLELAGPKGVCDGRTHS